MYIYMGEMFNIRRRLDKIKVHAKKTKNYHLIVLVLIYNVCLICYNIQVGDDVKMLPRRQYRIVRYNIITLYRYYYYYLNTTRATFRKRMMMTSFFCERWRINHGDNIIIIIIFVFRVYALSSVDYNFVLAQVRLRTWRILLYYVLGDGVWS